MADALDSFKNSILLYAQTRGFDQQQTDALADRVLGAIEAFESEIDGLETDGEVNDMYRFNSRAPENME